MLSDHNHYQALICSAGRLPEHTVGFEQEKRSRANCDLMGLNEKLKYQPWPDLTREKIWQFSKTQAYRNSI